VRVCTEEQLGFCKTGSIRPLLQVEGDDCLPTAQRGLRKRRFPTLTRPEDRNRGGFLERPRKSCFE
jgi:hypothetical protein